MTTTLTDKQIDNWRKILSFEFGSYAFSMPKEEVQILKDKMQERINEDTK